MAKLLQLRRGTTSQHSSFTGAVGEVTVDTDKDTIVVHDGSTAAGFPLAPNASPTFTGSHVRIPSVSTANLPGTGGGTYASQTAANGMLVYNSTLEMLQQRADGSWKGIAAAPTITSFQYSDGASATAEKTVVGLVSVSCTTQTSTTVLVPGVEDGIQVGMVVAGTGIPVGATVVSVIEDTSTTPVSLTSFVLSAAATASATVTLTFGGAVTITGSNFDSILAGGAANISVTFDGTSATSISVNSLRTIITCTPPAHAAGTITLLLTNASGLTASTNFVYDEEAIFTTAAGTLGNFVDGDYIADGDAPRIQATDGEGSPTALTTGFQRVTSAADDTVITTTIQGLTVLTSGYLTGTLSATEGTTYPFYATAKDSQNQRTAPRLFNIISVHKASGGVVTTYGSFRVHTFKLGGDTTFIPSVSVTVDYLIIAGGGAGGNWHGGGGGAGGVRTAASLALTATTYTITVGDGGAGGSTSVGSVGADSSMAGSDITTITATGGGRGGHYLVTTPNGGGSGAGGNGVPHSGSSVTYATGQAGIGNGSGTFGSAAFQGYNGSHGGGHHGGGGGGGAGGTPVNAASATSAAPGGVGTASVMGLSTADSKLLLDNAVIGEVSGSSRYVAGGGAGGTYAGSAAAVGGLGGGGDGGFNYNAGAPVVALDHMGAGGGGSGTQGDPPTSGVDYSVPTTGGSGVVIFRYLV